MFALPRTSCARVEAVACGPNIRQLGRGLGSGLLIGVSASGVFLSLLLRPTLAEATNGAIAWAATAIMIGSATTGGGWFARMVARGRGESSSWKTIAGVGVIFAVAGTVGLGGTFGIAFLVGNTVVHRPLTNLEAFRIAFVTASALIALVCTLVASRAFGLGWRGGVATAVLVAGATAATYLLVALVVDPLPGLRVGSGDRAMPKVAALCNFFAGLVGGSVAFGRLVRARRQHS
jgi:hypothetical protein